jgi:hypothetical protein
MATKKKEVKIFVNSNSSSNVTQELYSKLANILSDLNKKNIIIKLFKVKAGMGMVKQLKITKLPTLICEKDRKIGITDIINYLSAFLKERRAGPITAPPEEQLHEYSVKVLDLGDEEKSDELDEQNLRQKMEEFQKKRPQMLGVTGPDKIKGGKPIKRVKGAGDKFTDDSAGDQKFISQSGKNVEPTPTKKYDTEEDGESILEDYFLDEAIRNGKKVSPTRRKH